MQTRRYYRGRDTNQCGHSEPGQPSAPCGHGGAPRRGPETGLPRGLRAADAETQAGQVAKMRVGRGQPAAAAGLPGRGRAGDPGGVGDRGRAPAARHRLPGRRLQEQGGLLCEEEQEGAEPAVGAGQPGVRGPVLRPAGAVFCSGGGGESTAEHTAC